MRRLSLIVVAAALWFAPLVAQQLAQGTIQTTGGTVAAIFGTSPAVSFTVAGTFSAQLKFEVLTTDWFEVAVIRANSTNTPMVSTTTPGLFVVGNAGYLQARVRAQVFNSGVVTVTAMRGAVPPPPPTTTPTSPLVKLPVQLCNPVTLPFKPLGQCQ